MIRYVLYGGVKKYKRQNGATIMKTGKRLALILPALILIAPAGPAVAGAGAVAGAIASEIVTPIMAEQIMQGVGISSSDAVDYQKIGKIVESVVNDQARKQTMRRLLGELGGVTTTAGTILNYVKADNKRRKTKTYLKYLSTQPSSNDRKIDDLIVGLTTPLDQILGEFEKGYTSESHAVLEPYMTASDLKLSLLGLQYVRARLDVRDFRRKVKALGGKGKKKVAEFVKAIKDRNDYAYGHALNYAAQVKAATDFAHALTFNARQAMAKTYVARNIDKCSVVRGNLFLGSGRPGATIYPFAPRHSTSFRDRANYDPYDATGGSRHPFGAVRYKLRNLYTDQPFPTFKRLGVPSVKMQIEERIKAEEYYGYSSPAACKTGKRRYVDTSVPFAVFYQTEIRYAVTGVYDALEKHRIAAKKSLKKLPRFKSKERAANLKMARHYANHAKSLKK